VGRFLLAFRSLPTLYKDRPLRRPSRCRHLSFHRFSPVLGIASSATPGLNSTRVRSHSVETSTCVVPVLRNPALPGTGEHSGQVATYGAYRPSGARHAPHPDYPCHDTLRCNPWQRAPERLLELPKRRRERRRSCCCWQLCVCPVFYECPCELDTQFRTYRDPVETGAPPCQRTVGGHAARNERNMLPGAPRSRGARRCRG